MRLLQTLHFLAATTLSNAAAEPLTRRQTSSNTAVVDLSVNRGQPKHLASGFIYGIPDNENQIPDHWYTNMGFEYNRGGGAQMGAPNRGWIWGLNEYKGRFQSTLSNYQVTVRHGGTFIILPHDIWGTDNANSSTHWPGDNGDWSSYDAFLNQLLSDIKANNMVDHTVFDIWNEPDISIFWARSAAQWVQLYVRTHQRIRSDPALNGMLISGPTLAYRPASSNNWWTSWLQAIKSNNTVPDQYAYHLEGGTTDVDNDLQTSSQTLSTLLSQYGLPSRQININEYANTNEQVPAGAAWWISRFERYDAIGLRGNWRGGCVLHDLFADLLTKSSNPNSCGATDYAPAPEYPVYQYYNLNMTGHRVSTIGTGDRKMDVYATVGSDGVVRVLCGVRITTGTWYITIDNLSSVGLPTSGSLAIQTWGFPGGSSVFSVAPGLQNKGIVSHTYSGNSVTFAIYQTDSSTAWAFEFKAASG
ncbi:conserved hypothetical protein [Talaromyces stipitatus ATCC 10500]|uniref:Glycoside hydrolase family 39 protein n=1 Tax=Talaromyces stipitatus (strain ATCC 10500 / CBS 375.48 / QM 6759 / NRRL 1006) TaxID=441959 RepID=B8MAG1_TALSN|nr:uncharacterized protein TSTA_123910 [Talaromyces stipitatus ATCC 10500]EED18663.1 conserved hypothetical protein [Talaromyces stipitatus ATCC 10500]